MKKIIALFIAGLLTAGLCMSAAAAVPQRIRGLHREFSKRVVFTLDGAPLKATQLEKLEAYPGSELAVILAGEDNGSDLFLDQNGLPIATADVTVSKMRAANVAVQVDAFTGGDLIDRVELDVANAGTLAAKPVAHLYFVSENPSVEAQPFKIEFLISIGGVAQEQSRLTIEGTLGNYEQTLTGSDTVADSSDGSVLVAETEIPAISLEVGCAVTLTASLNAGGRYWAVASSSGEQYDAEMLQRYPAINDILILRTAGFGDGQIRSVRIKAPYTMYVYTEDGKFIGTTDGVMPYADKYVLALKKFDW